MAVSSGLYDYALKTLLNGEWKWSGTLIYCMLTTSSYTVTKASDDYINDVEANEISGTGYTAGGRNVTTPTISNPATLVVTCDCEDQSWTTATFTANKAVFFYNTAGASSTDPVICYVKFGGDVSVAGGTFTITIAATGLFTFTNGAEV